MVDDLIIIKADGYPTYNFAHIIDDLEMGVTHIMRGDEFISSMPKFLSIYDALEIPYPVFVSLPPILRPDRTKKLGKRDGSKDILDYRKDGFLPEALRNFLALIGWNPGTEQELFSMEELIANFSLEKIQRAGGAFNEEKLLWMNREYLNKLTDAAFVTYITPYLVDATDTARTTDCDLIARLAPTLRERISVASELEVHLGEGEFDFAFATPSVTPTQLQWKKDTSPKDALPRLTEALRLLETADFSTADTIKAALWDYAEAVGRGELLWPLRVALTGRERSPDPFTVAYIIGKDATRIRLQNAITQLATE
jgi:glutamyl/glutaminyl-tRNA synthetase